MGLFFKRCNHEYEIVSNQDIYENEDNCNFCNSINNDNLWTTSTTTYTLSPEFSQFLRDKKIDADYIIKVLKKTESEKDKKIIQLKNQLKEHNKKVIGHYFCQCCKKCGDVKEHIKYFKSIKNDPYIY